jgi:hypothetical protein
MSERSDLTLFDLADADPAKDRAGARRALPHLRGRPPAPLTHATLLHVLRAGALRGRARRPRPRRARDPASNAATGSERGIRACSEGCVRIERAMALALHVLRRVPEWTEERVQRDIDALRHRVLTLPEPMPVYVAYLPTWVDDEGGRALPAGLLPTRERAGGILSGALRSLRRRTDSERRLCGEGPPTAARSTDAERVGVEVDQPGAGIVHAYHLLLDGLDRLGVVQAQVLPGSRSSPTGFFATPPAAERFVRARAHRPLVRRSLPPGRHEPALGPSRPGRRMTHVVPSPV